jgi:hypothetical protein
VAELRYGEHAQERMEERGVTEEDVELALRRQVDVRPGEPGTIWIDGSGTGDRIIPVCVPIADQEFIITVGWPKQRRLRR